MLSGKLTVVGTSFASFILGTTLCIISAIWYAFIKEARTWTMAVEPCWIIRILKKCQTKMLSSFWHMIPLQLWLKACASLKSDRPFRNYLWWYLSCLVSPPVSNFRSEADCGAGLPHVPSIPRPQLRFSGAADEPLCMWKCIPRTDVVRHVPDSCWLRL